MAKYEKKPEQVAQKPQVPKTAEKKASKPEAKDKAKKNKNAEEE